MDSIKMINDFSFIRLRFPILALRLLLNGSKIWEGLLNSEYLHYSTFWLFTAKSDNT